MADTQKSTVTEDESERSFSESECELANDTENSQLETPQKDVLGKVAEGSEYESAEDEKEKTAVEISVTEPELQEPETPSEVVDEEGGEEGIAENEEVDGDFLSGDPNDDASEEEDDGEYVEEERQQGDGEECSPANAGNEKELDFDEDRRNPQYIPKKGIFYEHDDRNNEENKEKVEEPPRDRKKKLWLDEGKWGHDRFREEEQYPKSKHELIETYGYDIRNEDGPPRARRRRRYGRGPTKYDRSWEDVTAYGREKLKSSPRGGPARGRRPSGRFRGAPRFRGRGRRDFNSDDPVRGEGEEGAADDEGPVTNGNEDTKPATDPAPVINTNDFPALPSQEVKPCTESPPDQTYTNSGDHHNPVNAPDSKSVRTLTFENSTYGSRNSVERDAPPRRSKTQPPSFVVNHDRGPRRPNPRGNRGGRGDYRGRGRSTMRHISPRFMDNKVNNMSVDMERLTLDTIETCNNVSSDVAPQLESNGVIQPNPSVVEMPNMALKGAGDSSGRPKRYSSLRQRSLPETNAYQPPPPTNVPPPLPAYYETGFQTTLYAPQETCVPTPSTQSQTVTSTPIMNPSAYQTFTPPPYTDSYALRMPVTTPPPRLFPQVSVPTPQPLLPPPPCIAPAPNIMNFAAPPPPTGYHQFTYQQYATPPPPPPPAPTTELYQPGITYYYPPSQPPPVRPTVQKRPKAAIPILPPPERETKRKDKDSNQPSTSNRNFPETSADSGKVDVSLRTDAPPQLQTTVGVES